jgi:hypothetical protein
MSEYNVPNYKEQGGAKWVVDGELEITGTLDLTGATVEGVVTADVVNNLTTTASGKALDARQGKALKDTIDALALTVDGIAGDVAEIDGRMAANIPDSTEETSPTTAQFNALLAALKAAGLMVADGD